MMNQYADVCYQCGKWCKAGEGSLRMNGQHTRTIHTKCASERSAKSVEKIFADSRRRAKVDLSSVGEARW